MSAFSRIGAIGAGCLLGVAVSFAAPARADVAAPQPTPSASPIGHVVTSDRQDEPASFAARTTYVVDKADLIEHGWLNVGDAIEDVPGVELVRYGGIGAQVSAELRGASSNQVLVLMDGHPVAGTQLGGVDLATLSTIGVDRIEIVEGPGATLYGSGAVGGVINIISSTSRSAANRTTNATLAAGSFDARSFTVESPSFSFQSLSATNAYGYTLPDGTSGVRANADDRELHGSVNLHATSGALDLGAIASVDDRHLGVPGSLGFATIGERQNDGLASVLGTAAWHGAQSTISLDVSAMRQRINALDADPADAATAGTFNATSIESRTQVSLRDVVGSTASRLVYGIDLSREAVRNDDGYGDVAANTLSQSALYVQENVQVGPGSRVYAGLRGENDAGFGSALSPSLGAIVALGDALALRVNGATAFRAPTADELYFPNFGNPALQPERTTGGDVSLTANRVLGGASVGWFVQNGRDLISYDAASNADINVSRTSVAGFTLTLATLPLHGVTAKLNLTDTYRALDLTAQASRLTYRPVFVSNVEVAYAPHLPGPLDAVGLIAHTEGLRDPAGALPFTRVDAFVRVRVAPHALVSARLFNLGNESYQTVAGYPAPGRSLTIGLATR